MAAQVGLGEDDVLRLAHAHAPDVAVAEALESLADARARAAGRFPNPTLGWSREAIRGGQPSSQDILLGTVEIDVAGPLAERSLASAAAASTRASTSLIRTTAALTALLRFYDVVVGERRAAIAARMVEDLEEAVRILARREAVGTASGYASARIAIALDLARSHLADALSELGSRRIMLAATLGITGELPPIDADLTLRPMADEATLLGDTMQDHAALREARLAEVLVQEAERRARWAWVPTVQLGAGLKRLSDLGGGRGYVVGVTLELPLFQRGQTVSAEASAQGALSRARTVALERELSVEVSRQYALYVGAREELERFRGSATSNAQALLRAAQSGYQRGERSVVELLDAQRAVLEVSERELALLAAVKRAEVHLRAATGELE